MTRSISGSSFCSSRFTDFTARLTNTAIATIATAMTMNDSAITTMTQNIGSLVFICKRKQNHPIVDFRFRSQLPIARFTIGNRQSKICNALVRFRRIRSGFDPAGHFGLPFFFLIGFLAGVDCGRTVLVWRAAVSRAVWATSPTFSAACE